MPALSPWLAAAILLVQVERVEPALRICMAGRSRSMFQVCLDWCGRGEVDVVWYLGRLYECAALVPEVSC